jgi:hypothetical protein
MTARALVLLIFLATLCACDRTPPPQPSTAPAEPIFQLELKPLTPLLPNRPTHVAVDPLGNVYWVQEGDRRDDTLFVIGEGDIPRATQLSASTIAAQLNATSARGNIHGIASGPEGEIYFYFLGSVDRQTLAAFGRYFPKTAGIQILADTSAIANATGMGLSLALARAEVVSDSRIIWLLIRHTDAWAMFKIFPRNLPTAGPAALPRAFNSVKLGQRPVDLTREELEITPAPNGQLFVMDPVNGRVLRINQEGVAVHVRSLVGMPASLSTPAVDGKNQLLIFAAANQQIIAPSTIEDAAAAKPPEVTYPAMLIFGEQHTITIPRDAIIAYPGFPVFGLHLTDLIPHPREEGWISYDRGSGELLRLKIREKLWP